MPLALSTRTSHIFRIILTADRHEKRKRVTSQFLSSGSTAAFEPACRSIPVVLYCCRAHQSYILPSAERPPPQQGGNRPIEGAVQPQYDVRRQTALLYGEPQQSEATMDPTTQIYPYFNTAYISGSQKR